MITQSRFNIFLRDFNVPTIFTPNQLVFGHKPNILNNLVNCLIALEEVTTSDILAMHAARKRNTRKN